jgi:hypothetical protein
MTLGLDDLAPDGARSDSSSPDREPGRAKSAC